MPALLKEIDRPLASVSADGAYDKTVVYEAVANHTATRSPRVLIPPKGNAQVKPEDPDLWPSNGCAGAICSVYYGPGVRLEVRVA